MHEHDPIRGITAEGADAHHRADPYDILLRAGICRRCGLPTRVQPDRPRVAPETATCGAIWTSNVLGGMDICARLDGHTGPHSIRPDR